MSMKLANSQHNQNLQQYHMVYLFVGRLRSAALRGLHQSENASKYGWLFCQKYKKDHLRTPFKVKFSKKNSQVSHGIPICAETILRRASQHASTEKVCQGVGGSPAETPNRSFKNLFKVKNMTCKFQLCWLLANFIESGSR